MNSELLFHSFEESLSFCYSLLESYSDQSDPKIFLSLLYHLKDYYLKLLQVQYIFKLTHNQISTINIELKSILSYIMLYEDSPYAFRYKSEYLIADKVFNIIPLSLSLVSQKLLLAKKNLDHITNNNGFAR